MSSQVAFDLRISVKKKHTLPAGGISKTLLAGTIPLTSQAKGNKVTKQYLVLTR